MSRTRSKFLNVVLIVSMLGAVLFGVLSLKNNGLTPLGLFSPPVLVSDEEGDRLYMLSGQWRTTYFKSARAVSSTVRTHLLVDAWAFDAKTAKPLWRRRLQQERDGSMYARQLLGVHGDTMWLLIQGRPLALSCATGDVLVPVGHIEEVNPPLQGLMPVEDRYYAFDAHGLLITSADARTWRIDPKTAAATEAAAVDSDTGTACPPAFFTPAATYLFQERGLNIPGWWLGLLTDAEAKEFDQNNSIGGLDRDSRRRLWRAKANEAPNYHDGYLLYDDFEPLPLAPDFLAAGLLRGYKVGANLPPLWYRDPDSVLVLHRERLGDAGRLRLTRVAGPDGAIVWDTPMPLTTVQSVMQGKENLVLFGNEYRENDSDDRDPDRDAPNRLVSIELATGIVHAFEAEAFDTHIEATPVNAEL